MQITDFEALLVLRRPPSQLVASVQTRFKTQGLDEAGSQRVVKGTLLSAAAEW